MNTTIDLDPDAPHSPDRTRALADLAAETARTLNYATMPGRGGLAAPADAYELLGQLSTMAHRLPQLFEQIGRFLEGAEVNGRLAETSDGPSGGNVTLAVSTAAGKLNEAADAAVALFGAASAAQSAIRAVRYTGPDLGEQDGDEQ
jgi:hypothetical protein